MEKKSFEESLIGLQQNLDLVVRDTQAYNYRYAQLDQCWDSIRKPLKNYGFSFVQLPYNEGEQIGVHSRLIHCSGKEIESKIAVFPVKKDPQSMGSLLTYLRRYSLMAIFGISPVDDDAQSAMPSAPEAKPVKSSKPVYNICPLCDGHMYKSDKKPVIYCQNFMKKKDGESHPTLAFTGQDPIPVEILSNITKAREWLSEQRLAGVNEPLPF